MALRGMRQWAAPLIVIGSIGLVSALNTFCHIHTPIQLSVFRIINGAMGRRSDRPGDSLSGAEVRYQQAGPAKPGRAAGIMSGNIILSGYYGFGNTGDEAVLAGILATFREIGLDAEVTVLSADPARTVAEHPGVESIHRYKLGAVDRGDPKRRPGDQRRRKPVSGRHQREVGPLLPVRAAARAIPQEENDDLRAGRRAAERRGPHGGRSPECSTRRISLPCGTRSRRSCWSK